jgi:hypothetical protein
VGGDERVEHVKPPEWTAVLRRYSAPRVMRTRATQTAFRVRSEGDLIVVTTGAGSERAIPRTEFEAAWSYLERDAPKSQWKHVSANSSYLEAVFDDFADEARRHSPDGFDDTVLTTGLLRQEVADLRAQLDAARRAGRIPTEGEAAARSALHAAESEVAQLRTELQRVLEALRASEADLEVAIRQQGSVADTGEVDRLRRALLQAEKRAKTADARAERADAAREEETSELREQVDKLRRSNATTPKVFEIATLDVAFDLNGRRFASIRKADARVASLLSTAAKSVFSAPSASIVESRQVMELIVDRLWSATSTSPRPRRMGEALELLRGSPMLPREDWHLIKNLWSRASAIVHEGGATVEGALWIWLGTTQLAELTHIVAERTPADRARGDSGGYPAR